MADSSLDLSQARASFVDEARELLAQMEDILLRAEASPCSDEDLNALFRSAHTIKGSGGLFGLDEIVRFTHVVENVLDRLRKGSLHFDTALITLLLACQDHISGLIMAVADNAPMPVARGDELITQLQSVLDGDAPAVVVRTGIAEPPLAEPEAETTPGSAVMAADHWHLSLRFGEKVMQDGMDPLAFINYLNHYGRIAHVETVTERLPGFFAADPETCYLGFEVSLHSAASKAEIESVFEFVQDSSQIVILPPQSRIAEFLAQIETLHGDVDKVGEILVACGSVTASELAHALDEQKSQATSARIGEILVEQGAIHASVVDAAVKKQTHAEERRSVESKTLKVPADRLDALIDRVGELVIAGVGTYAQISHLDKPELRESADILLALVADIRDMALRLRMVAIGEVFSRFPRVVRDLSKELGKQVELRIRGGDAELDKSMIDKIGDPLMHLVRNAMDHGIEPVEVRRARGKPDQGTVELNAYHESGSINIEVRDDGGGIDRERIFQKAVAQGLVSPEAVLDDQDVYRLILTPGFSTAEQVTNLSGRGVGMDVVRSNIEALRGTLDIDSVPGQGTTMRLCLPLTLAIIDGFHVRVGHAHFIIPLELVIECLELPPDVGLGEYFEQRGEPLPFIRLREVFQEVGPAHPRPRIIVVRVGGRRVGLVVDRIHGKCQAVIKPLGPLFVEVPAVSGSTIIGNGEVGMILDVPALVRHCMASEKVLRKAFRPTPA